MGAWGTESCSNDDTWDCLEGNIHNMTQKNADDSIANVWSQEFKGAPNVVRWNIANNENIKLGVVIHILNQGLKVPPHIILEVYQIARCRLDIKVIKKEGWRDPEARWNTLFLEMRQLRTAYNADGQCIEKHVKGLLEKMDDMLT